MQVLVHVSMLQCEGSSFHAGGLGRAEMRQEIDEAHTHFEWVCHICELCARRL